MGCNKSVERCSYNVFYFVSFIAAEYQRLLQQYPINQDLVKSVGKGYYQIVNVAQFHHHQYTGLTTREGTNKGPRSQPQGMQATQQQQRVSSEKKKWGDNKMS